MNTIEIINFIRENAAKEIQKECSNFLLIELIKRISKTMTKERDFK